MPSALPTQTTRYRGLEIDQVSPFITLPLAPAEVFVTPSYYPDILDIRWDNPASKPENKGLAIVGVNLYRSYDDNVGNFQKVNTTPIGALYYRDIHLDTREIDAPVQWLSKGTNSLKEFVFQVAHLPIVKPNSLGAISRDPSDIEMKFNGEVIPALSVNGETGQVWMITSGWFDQVLRRNIPAKLPLLLSDVVTCSYSWTKSWVIGSVKNRLFYRVTTVLADGRETPLTETLPHEVGEVERLDYMWEEAIRRNAWILDQGGERVKVFLRKWIGPACKCFDYQHESPKSDCIDCYGTGIQGGFEGPYNIIMTPADVNKTNRLTKQGFVPEMTYEVWTGPNPVLSHWDLIVKSNGERFSVGGVKATAVRGVGLQQSFNLALLPYGDIRYAIPMGGQDRAIVPIADTSYLQPWGDPKHSEQPPPPPPSEADLTDVSPTVTVNPKQSPGLRKSGRTVTFDQITY